MFYEREPSYLVFHPHFFFFKREYIQILNLCLETLKQVKICFNIYLFFNTK